MQAAVNAVAGLNAGCGAYVCDAPDARIDQQLAWTFGHLTAGRLAALAWAFLPEPPAPVDAQAFADLAARDGAAYLSGQECQALADQLAEVYRERRMATEARKRFGRMLRCTPEDVRLVHETLGRIFAEATQAGGYRTTLAPIVLVHADSPEEGCVTHEVALHLAVLFGIVEDLDADGFLRRDALTSRSP